MRRFPRHGYGCSVRRKAPPKRRLRYLASFALAVIVLAGAGAMARAADLQRLHTGTAHEAYFDIEFHRDMGLAVGAGGALLRTRDGGQSWQKQRLDKINRAVLGVDVQAERILAVGQDGLILRCDHQHRWRKLQSPTEARLFDVASNGDGLAAAVGAFGAAVVSTDGGRQWRQLRIDWGRVLDSANGLIVEPHLYAVHVDPAGAITLAGEFELVMRSVNQGRDWTVVHKGDASIFAMDFTAGEVGYAVGQDGLALVTRDGGQNWKYLDVGSDANLLDVNASPDGEVVISGIRELRISRDHGRSWASLKGGGVKRMWYQALARNAQGEVYVVGQAASVLKLSR